MREDYYRISRALRLVQIGYRFWCTLGIVSLGAGLLTSGLLALYFLKFWWLAIVLIPPVVAPLVSGFIGRIQCLKTAENLLLIRGPMAWSMVFEIIGWVNLIIGVPLSVVITQSFITWWIPLAIGLGFTVLMHTAARILFLQYLRLLAGTVDDAAVRRARLSLTHFSVCLGIFIIAASLVFISEQGIGRSFLQPMFFQIPIAFFGLYIIFVTILYDRLLSTLKNSVRAFADTLPDEIELGNSGPRIRGV